MVKNEPDSNHSHSYWKCREFFMESVGIVWTKCSDSKIFNSTIYNVFNTEHLQVVSYNDAEYARRWILGATHLPCESVLHRRWKIDVILLIMFFLNFELSFCMFFSSGFSVDFFCQQSSCKAHRTIRMERWVWRSAIPGHTIQPAEYGWRFFQPKTIRN